MRFKNEYLGEFYQGEEHEKAQLLWLWYDYHTEIFDRGLWSAKPFRYDETMVVLTSRLAQKESDMHVWRVRTHIYEVAKNLNISSEIMNRAKIDSYRSPCKMQDRIDAYLELNAIGEFDFISE